MTLSTLYFFDFKERVSCFRPLFLKDEQETQEFELCKLFFSCSSFFSSSLVWFFLSVVPILSFLRFKGFQNKWTKLWNWKFSIMKFQVFYNLITVLFFYLYAHFLRKCGSLWVYTFKIHNLESLLWHCCSMRLY